MTSQHTTPHTPCPTAGADGALAVIEAISTATRYSMARSSYTASRPSQSHPRYSSDQRLQVKSEILLASLDRTNNASLQANRITLLTYPLLSTTRTFNIFSRPVHIPSTSPAPASTSLVNNPKQVPRRVFAIVIYQPNRTFEFEYEYSTTVNEFSLLSSGYRLLPYPGPQHHACDCEVTGKVRQGLQYAAK